MTTLADLERRYDGPIPPRERDAARGLNTAHLEAVGNTAFFRNMARRQIATIRCRRQNRTDYPALLADLRLYLARYRYWRRRTRQLTNPGAAP